MAIEYPPTPLSVIASGKWLRPRASVTGIVTEVRHEADGDTHVRLADGVAFIICEVIPELPLSHLPTKGQKVTIRGIVRFDGEHAWWELHPMVSWSPA